jgi:hypothetical protein
MQTKTRLIPLLLAACSLTALHVSAAPGDVIFRNVRTTVLVDLAPTPAAPASASGSAKIKIRQVNATQTASLRLTLEGLTPGKYRVFATLTNASIVAIGGFRITAAGVPAEPGKDDGTILRTIPAAVDATKIASLAVKDANSTAILEGDTAVDSVSVNFIANVRITGPNPNTFPGFGVHGHAVAHSKSLNGVETGRVFLWNAFGAPPNTALTINVDGTAVGTVSSTNQGQVIFSGLDASVDLTAMKLITLTDSTNTIVMLAQF